MHDGPPSDLPAAAAASAAPVHLWRFSRTQRLVTAAAAVVMIPLAFAPVLMLVAAAVALNDNPIAWIVVAVLALLGAVGLILPLVALLVISAAPIAARWRVELTGRELHLRRPARLGGAQSVRAAPA